MAGAAIALPFLESMVPALRGAVQGQMRAAFIYTPHGVILKEWVPEKTGTDYEMKPILQPLAGFRDRFTILSNLAENKGKQAGSGHASSSLPG